MNAFGTADRYWQTIRHLKPGQITGRIRYRVFKPQPDLSPEPRVRGRVGQWQVPASRPASMTGPGRFMFLNEDGSLDNDGWDNPQRDKLWTYNQHYFDDLNADGSGGRTKWHRQLMANWIGSNPPGIGTGWEPYPTSLRIVNWIKWILAGNQPEGEVLSSLAIQARWLAKRLEWHLLGNHLLANAKALVFAGLFFDGVEAREWRETGFKIVEREIREQILPDGGHFELSPMYHALVLEDFLDLLNLTRAFPDVETGQVAKALRDRIPSMLGWLSTMSHPDGKISFFNDAAFGIACENRSLEEYAQRLGIAAVAPSQSGLTHLPDSGYVRLLNRDAAVIADFARIGPDYLPGHAHADTLSLEASLFGHRVLVNSGTSLYGTGPERLRQRGTLAHNTVTIGNKNSSEVWSGFRVARRASVFDVTCGSQDGTLSAAASHDGYMRLKGRPVHRRTVSLTKQRLKISDSMTSTVHEAVARFHIHPGVEVERTSDVSGKFRLPFGRSVDWQVEGGEPSIQRTTWHPEFGKSIDTNCLTIPTGDGQFTLNITWD